MIFDKKFLNYRYEITKLRIQARKDKTLVHKDGYSSEEQK